MRCFTAHRRDTGLFTGPETVLVKEGFCWPAFFLTFVWALGQRMWLTAACLLAVPVAAGFLSAWLGLSDAADLVLNLGIMTFIGFNANDWRRISLGRRGYEDAGIVCGRNSDEAEFRLLDAERSGTST